MAYERPVLSYIQDDGWRFRFGKYGGWLVGDVYRENPSYISWALENMGHLTDDEKKVFNVTLGKLPHEAMPNPLVNIAPGNFQPEDPGAPGPAQEKQTSKPKGQLSLFDIDVQVKIDAAQNALYNARAATLRAANAEMSLLNAKEQLAKERRLADQLNKLAKKLLAEADEAKKQQESLVGSTGNGTVTSPSVGG